MAFVKAIDVSRHQGTIDWPAVRAAGVQIAIIKISGSDDGDYYDSKASQNYYAAKAAGLAIGGYHFAGAGDPVHEAEYFVAGMRPFEENDVFVLDWEVQHPNPVAWCATFCARVQQLTGVWPMVYMNGSTFNAYGWNSNPTIANCGKWIAWYGRDPEATLPVNGTYVMHQYSSTGRVAGIVGNVDMDAWYGSVAQFQKYGYHAPAAPSQPAPTPAPVITTKDETNKIEVPFLTLRVEDPNKTTTEVTQEGKVGERTVVTTITYSDGNETSRAVTSDSITIEPVNQITTVGTKVEPTPEPPQEPSEPSEPSNGTDEPNEPKNDSSGLKKLLIAIWVALVKFWKS